MTYRTPEYWEALKTEADRIVAMYANKGLEAHQSIGKRNGFYIFEQGRSPRYVTRVQAKKDVGLKS